MLNYAAGGLLLRLLQPELIHVDEDFWVLGLERVPAVEIGHCLIVREARAVGLRRRVGKAEEGKFVIGEKGLDLWNRELVLLHVEQQVAGFARSEEVGISRHVL